MKKDFWDKFMYRFSLLVIGIAFACLLVVIYWLSYPYDVNDIKSLKVLDTNVIAGQPFRYQVSYCKKMDLPGTVTRTYTDNVIYSEPSFISNNPVGCHENVVSIVAPNLTTDSYVVGLNFQYHPNPIRTIQYHVSSDPFTIKEVENGVPESTIKETK